MERENLKFLTIKNGVLSLACLGEDKEDLGYYASYDKSYLENKLFMDRLNIPNNLIVNIHDFNEMKNDKTALSYFLSQIPKNFIISIYEKVTNIRIVNLVIPEKGSKNMSYDQELTSAMTYNFQTKKYSFKLIASFNYVIKNKADYANYYNWYLNVAKQHNSNLELIFKRPIFNYDKAEILNVSRRKVIVTKDLAMISVNKNLGDNYTAKTFIATPWFFNNWNESAKSYWKYSITEQTKKLIEYIDDKFKKYTGNFIPLPNRKYDELTKNGFILLKVSNVMNNISIQRYTDNILTDNCQKIKKENLDSVYLKQGYMLNDAIRSNKHILKLSYSPDFYEDFDFQMNNLLKVDKKTRDIYNYYYCQYITRTIGSLTRAEQYAAFQFTNMVKIMCKILNMDYYDFLTNKYITIC